MTVRPRYCRVDCRNGSRGWLAATTVAIMLSLVLLAVEKHLRLNHSPVTSTPLRGGSNPPLGPVGILLSADPGLAGVSQPPQPESASIGRKTDTSALGATSLRRPPEPAASIALFAPVPTAELAQLPLYSSSSKITYLMDAIDKAFESPLQTVSAQRASESAISSTRIGNYQSTLPSPASTAARIPQPKSLMAELDNLQNLLSNIEPTGLPTAYPSLPDTLGRPRQEVLSRDEANLMAQWLMQVRMLLNRIVFQHGLEHPESVGEMVQLAKLAEEAASIGEQLGDYEAAMRMLRINYALQRRVVVWQAIQRSLDGTSIALFRPRHPDLAREDLLAAIAAVDALLGQTDDAQAWRNYLLLGKLSDWVRAPASVWQTRDQVGLQVLARLHSQELDGHHRRFLNQPAFEELASQLSIWGRDPVDYRQLLTELEQLELDPISRVGSSLAAAVHMLRLSGEPRQQAIASVLNDHYRNANIRLSMTQELIERFLPSGNEYELRPVRQRILGADTYGDSAIKTELRIKLIPDEQAWNIDVGVLGDLHSMTRSSKGPAVFHNSSTAQITSHRYVRLSPEGYQVTAEPTDVNSQDYLRKMSTDFDGLPIIGDFVRLMVREQFEQKRGLAQRISRRIIAQETDAELNRRLQAGLSTAEQELQQRLIGPLERLNLNPMVVAMSTSQERLTIRYRVANEQQMAAYSPRPRAPGDSLLSIQFHQSAINNAIERLGLSGRTWALPELYERLGQVFQQSEWELPADIPRDISIRFADTRPVTLELEEGRLRLTLRIAELHQPSGLHIERFIITTNYIPAAHGLSAELIRDGVVEINSSTDRLQDRFKLRLIFAKVFVENSQIPLINKNWTSDPRAEGLAVSQLEIRDGWLSVAISPTTSHFAAEVATRAEQLRLTK